MGEKLYSLSDVKKESYIIESIIWDMDPKSIMEPVSRLTDEGVQYSKPLEGYFFYIDTMGSKPALFLMRLTSINFGKTLAQITELPQELLDEALEENKSRMKFGMCPINKKIEEWLKKELGVL